MKDTNNKRYDVKEYKILNNFGFIQNELLITVIALVFILSFFIVQLAGNKGNSDTVSQDKVFSEIDYTYSSDEITDVKELRKVIISQLQSQPDEIKINYHGKDIKTGADVIRLIKNIQYSSNYYGNNLHQYSLDTKGDLKKTQDGAYEILLYNLIYRTSKKEESYIDKQVDRIAKKHITDDMSEYERVRFVFDYIVDNKEYTTQTYNNGQSAYSFFKNGKGVCHSYALAAAKLLDKAGVQNHFVFGDTNQQRNVVAHTWNKVMIDDEWYNIDTTWADKEDNRDEYFLISDKALSGTHTPRTKEYMPKARSKKFE